MGSLQPLRPANCKSHGCGLAGCERLWQGCRVGAGPGRRRQLAAAAPGPAPAHWAAAPTAVRLQVKKAMTMTEKILAKHSDKPSVVPGDNVRRGRPAAAGIAAASGPCLAARCSFVCCSAS